MTLDIHACFTQALRDVAAEFDGTPVGVQASAFEAEANRDPVGRGYTDFIGADFTRWGSPDLCERVREEALRRLPMSMDDYHHGGEFVPAAALRAAANGVRVSLPGGYTLFRSARGEWHTSSPNGRLAGFFVGEDDAGPYSKGGWQALSPWRLVADSAIEEALEKGVGLGWDNTTGRL